MNIKSIAVFVMAFALASCRLNVVSPEGGYIATGGGAVCNGGEVCYLEVTDPLFDETFTAYSAPGYEMVGWDFKLVWDYAPTKPISLPCDNADSYYGIAQCQLNFSRMEGNIGNINKLFIDGESQGFLMPVYKQIAMPIALPSDPEPEPEPSIEVIRGYDIPNSHLESTLTKSTELVIPKGIIVAQAFTMPLTPQYGKFVFHHIPTLVAPTHNIWISNTAGGTPISDTCYLSEGNKASELRYASPIAQGLDWWCGLIPGEDYYLNIAHDDPELPNSRIERLVKVTAIIEPTQAEVDAFIPGERVTRSSAERTKFIYDNACPSTDLLGGSCAGFHVDHIIPLACGGADTASNMQWLSAGANMSKGSMGCRYAP